MEMKSKEEDERERASKSGVDVFMESSSSDMDFDTLEAPPTTTISNLDMDVSTAASFSATNPSNNTQRISTTEPSPQQRQSFFSSGHIRSLLHGAGGVVAGLTSSAILQPFDVIKTRLQVSGSTATSFQYRNMWHAVSSVIREEGLRSLYKGSAPNVLGNAMAWGTYMLSYNAIKAHYQQPDRALAPTTHLFAGTMGGIISLFVVNPVWVVKTRMILQTNATTQAYTSMRHAFKTIYKQEGIRGFYKGVKPGIVGTTHGGFQFMAYEACKKHLLERYNNDDNTSTSSSQNQKLRPHEYVLAAIASKWFAGIVTYPYQVVRAREQIRGNTQSTLQVIQSIIKKSHIRGFYKGMAPYLIRTVPSTVLTFLVYEEFMKII